MFNYYIETYKKSLIYHCQKCKKYIELELNIESQFVIIFTFCEDDLNKFILLLRVHSTQYMDS